ncbi:NACHT and WD repeat domain-containing protein 2 [Denticeps clupeoides]|uniref:NACHT and WD repeat domain-containing protein 2 n=1 Tax=Denticeps clupeoides TaxID=299321 RepID=UPI0010A36D80|nr:NACHT and WD repeat domain-containing protein 2-like [Denticeps clupeoides]
MPCVKVYLCSNPEDSAEERRALRETVFPRLRDYCRRRHGLDFRVIDPYEVPNPQQWPSQQVRMQLLQECRGSSAGPFFMGLVGGQYGAVSVPEQVEVSEFQEILLMCQAMGLSPETLEKSYQRDENAVPASFCLRRQREATTEALREILHAVLPQCVFEGRLSSEKAQKYFRSGLENELRFAVEKSTSDDETARCFCYVHKIINRDKRVPEEEALSDERLAELAERFLPSTVSSGCMAVFTTTSECDRQFGYTAAMRQKYTEGLCEQVYSDFSNAIDRTVRKETAHAGDTFGQIYSQLYRTECVEVQHIKNYLQQKDTKYPLVVIGQPCSGKTVLLGHCANQVKTWLNSPVVITNFANISLSQLLISVSHQIASSLNHPWDPCLEDIAKMKEVFPDILKLASSSQHPLVLILDGLDQLSDQTGLVDFTWLPASLPSNVKLVISTTPSKSRTLSTLKARYFDSNLFIEMKPMDKKSCSQMLRYLLQSSQRRITSGQQMYVNESLKQCTLPLHVELVFRQVRSWSSELEATEDSLAKCVHDNIARFFEKLEDEYGQALVTRSLSLVTLSRYGITATELTDILSCDDDNASKFLQPENFPPYKLRFPEAVTESLLLSLKGFLVTRCLYGADVLFWVSRHFKLVVYERYLSSKSLACELHHTLADYFKGQWAYGRAKPLTAAWDPDATSSVTPTKMYIDRLSPGQPWVLGAFNSNSTSICTMKRFLFNVRKVLELPFHLLQSNRFEELSRDVMMSLGFQQAMLDMRLGHELVSWLEETSRLVVYQRELGVLASILKQSLCSLQGSPANLPLMMLSALLPFLQLFPELDEYAKQICKECNGQGTGVAVVLSPTPPVPSSHWAPAASPASITEVSVAQGETAVVILNDGSGWTWNVKTHESFQISPSHKIKFTGVKSMGNILLLSTQCNRLFLWDMNQMACFEEITVLRSESNQKDHLSVEGFLVSREKMFWWYRGEHYAHMCDTDNTLKILQLQCPNIVTCVSCTRNSVYCGQEKGAVSIFDIHSSRPLATCICPTAASLIALHFCEGDSGTMVCIDMSGSLFVWDTQSSFDPMCVEEHLSADHSGDVLNMDLSEGNDVLLVCKKSQILFWDMNRYYVEDRCNAPQGSNFVQALLSQDSHFIFALLEGCSFLLVWKWSSGQCVLTLSAGCTQVLKLIKMNDTHLTEVTAKGLNTWDLDLISVAASISKTGVKETKVVMVEALVDHFYTTDGTGVVWRWDAHSGKVTSHFVHHGPVEALAVSPNGEYVVALASGDIFVWQSKTGANLHRICGSRASRVLITPNGSFGVSLSEQGLSRVWKLVSGNVVCCISPRLRQAVVSPESTFLLGLQRGILMAVNLWSGYVSKSFASFDRSPVLAFSPLLEYPDYVIVVTSSGTLCSWRLSDDSVCLQFQTSDPFLCHPGIFQVSLDGNYAILSSVASSISILDLSQHKLCSVEGEGQIKHVCLHVSGKYAVYISDLPITHLGCSCKLQARFVLVAVRVSNGKTVARLPLLKGPSGLSIMENMHVYVVYNDGSVGIYAITDADEGITTSRTGFARVGEEQPDSCEEPVSWLPLAAPTITWVNST